MSARVTRVPTPEDVRDIVPGDQVRMPCDPAKWQTVEKVRDLSTVGHTCFVIDCAGGVGHGGEMPLEIRGEPEAVRYEVSFSDAAPRETYDSDDERHNRTAAHRRAAEAGGRVVRVTTRRTRIRRAAR